MKLSEQKSIKRDRRHARIRARVKGTAEAPRLAVFKSNKYVYAQLIDDDKSVTLVAASSLGAKSVKGGATDRAKQVGVNIAKLAKDKKIGKVVFDRGGFLYRGQIKAVADGAREGGLIF